MKKPGIFLTADWRNLVMLNYAVDPLLLEGFVPRGTALDSFEGKTYVSLVGFEFNRTRVAGFRVPLHGSFEEVNLRFYVKRGERRGVVFIRELVPKYLVAAVARMAFGENYSCVPMSHSIGAGADKDAVAAEYCWGSGAARCTMRMETEGPEFLPEDGSLGQFITEHYWGYSAQRDGSCIEYEVQHPRWSVSKAGEAGFGGRAAEFYGVAFGKVLECAPDSAFMAGGSSVVVFKGTKVE